MVVSRSICNHTYFKKRLEDLGFNDVFVTAIEKDGLNAVIKEIKPKIMIVSSKFYQSATPYMMALVKRKFKKLNIAAVSMFDYPADLAMKFIINGVNSYLNYFEGKDQFYNGLEKLSEGKIFVSASVLERMEKRRDMPPPAHKLTERETEVLRLLCNGFTSVEIAEELCVSKRTVEFHKKGLFNNLSTRNENELIRVALYLGLINVDELNFYGRNFELPPKPKKN